MRSPSKKTSQQSLVAGAITTGADFQTAFPNSRKIFVEGPHGIRVPMREISLSGGEPPLRVYDTSGPQGEAVSDGLPPLRSQWIRSRNDVEEIEPLAVSYGKKDDAAIPDGLKRRRLRGTSTVTQMHYARRGEITPEMEFIAIREGIGPEFVRDEVARG